MNTNSSAKSFDLLRNKSLQALEFTGIGYMVRRSPEAVSTLKHVFTTIASPAFFEVTIIYRDVDFQASYNPPRIYASGGSRREIASRHHKMFEVFHEIREIRDFRLVLCAVSWHPLVECMVRELEWAVNIEWVGRGSEKNSSRPVVTSSLQVFLSATGLSIESQMGWCGPFKPWYSRFLF